MSETKRRVTPKGEPRNCLDCGTTIFTMNRCKPCHYNLHKDKLSARARINYRTRLAIDPVGLKKKITDTALRQNHNLSLDEYNVMLAKQNGVCAICSKPERCRYRGKIRMLAVDHDHVTGKIRNLLCFDCNTGLGCFRENIAMMKSAIKYLESDGAEIEGS